jgi:thioredoxin 1
MPKSAKSSSKKPSKAAPKKAKKPLRDGGATRAADAFDKLTGKTPGVIILTDDNFDDELDTPDLVLVDFTASWCGPCKTIAPLIIDVAETYKGLKVGKLDVDACPKITTRYRIQSMPTLVLFRGGKPVGKMIGAGTRAEIGRLVEKHL